MNIYIDIETIPDCLGSWDDPDPDKRALGIATCRIASLAVATDDTDAVWYAEVGEPDELALLEQLRAWLSDVGVSRSRAGVLVGHNIRGFDLPVLTLWALRHRHPLKDWFPRVKPGGKPWDLDGRIVDTQALASGTAWKPAGVRQRDLAAFFGIALDEDPGDGSNVARWWLEGRRDLIAAHNLSDVRVLRQLLPWLLQ